MRFRELSKFNDSLLAKQVWRLKTHTESLFYKVFKVNIFPNCSIMEYDNPNKGSFTWKIFLQARHVLDLGTIWRVGDGESIVSRGDKWLPSTLASKVVSSVSVLHPDSRICDLIDHETHTWRRELIS